MNLRTLFCCMAAAFALTLCAFAADVVDSGTCGENLTWTLDSDGVLTISGTGAMDNWNVSLAAPPWEKNRDSIVTAIINSGVTSIGNFAFQYYHNLTGVTLPDSLVSIGNFAFYFCNSLTSITIPNHVTSIGNYAFGACENLTNVKISASDHESAIGDYAFWSCRNLTNVTIPDGVTSIGWCAFYNCIRLTSVTIPDSVIDIGSSAFIFCVNLSDIYYAGSAAQWNEACGEWHVYNENNVTVHYNAKDIGVGITLTDKNGDTVDANGQTGETEETKKDAFQDGAEFKASFDAVEPDAASGLVSASVFVIFYDKDSLMLDLTQKEIDLSDPFNLMFVLEIRIPEGAKTLKFLMLGDNFEPLRAVRLIESSADA